jgi:hypothetical protein
VPELGESRPRNGSVASSLAGASRELLADEVAGDRLAAWVRHTTHSCRELDVADDLMTPLSESAVTLCYQPWGTFLG